MVSLVGSIEEELFKILSEESAGSSRYLLAVSGGMDSMAMLHAFGALNLNFAVAHFNFKLRGEASDEDVALVVNYCQKRGIPVYSTSRDTRDFMKTHRLSLQEAARQLRYQFFEKTALENHLDYICTAHHANDQLETFFIHLFRGSGLKGLTGIPQIRDRIIRPMLRIPHRMIKRYVEQHNIPYREDESNQSDDYLRNRIRHHIIAPLTLSEPEHLINALHSISILHDYQEYINIQLQEFFNTYFIDVTPYIQSFELKDEWKNAYASSFLLKLTLLEQGIYIQSIHNFLASWKDSRTGSRFEGKDVVLWYDRERCWLIREDFYAGWSPDDQIEIPPEGRITLPGGDILEWSSDGSKRNESEVQVIALNPEKVKWPLKVRHRRPGDAMEAGQPPFFHKTLKKLLIEKRIPLPFKDRLYVLTDAGENIIAVLGVANNPRFIGAIESGSPSRFLIYSSFLLDITRTFDGDSNNIQ